MQKNGIVSLGDFALSAAAIYVGDPVSGFDNIKALTAQMRLQYGSGGATIKAFLQTSLDQGTTWIDIACAAMSTASENVALNFSSYTPKTTQYIATDGTLADDTAVDGILGDRFRMKVAVTGTYGGSTVLSVRVHPKA